MKKRESIYCKEMVVIVHVETMRILKVRRRTWLGIKGGTNNYKVQSSSFPLHIGNMSSPGKHQFYTLLYLFNHQPKLPDTATASLT